MPKPSQPPVDPLVPETKTGSGKSKPATPPVDPMLSLTGGGGFVRDAKPPTPPPDPIVTETRSD